MTTRRSFLGAMLAACAAPAYVKAGILMPVRKIIVPPEIGEFVRDPSPVVWDDWWHHGGGHAASNDNTVIERYMSPASAPGGDGLLKFRAPPSLEIGDRVTFGKSKTEYIVSSVVAGVMVLEGLKA